MKAISEVLAELKKRGGPQITEEEYERRRRLSYASNGICKPDCECGGLGFVKGEDGKLRPCGNADPALLHPGARYGLTDEERALTWSAVKPLNNTQAAAAAVRRVLTRGAGWVYLWGPPGLGKTLILKIAVAELLRGRRAAGYVRMPEIFDHLRAAFDLKNASEEAQRRLDFWADLPFLAIDEFGRERSSEYTKERRFVLMDRRYESALRGRSITLIASNDDPSELDDYLWDRIRNGRFEVIRVEGESVRPGEEWRE